MSEFTNQLGVKLVGSACLRLEWFFRVQHESDQGVDAIIEKAPSEMGTGRLLAIQIKSGNSYLREPTDNGWWFRFDAKKAKLWLGHALPVLVVLADVDNGTAYWQRICNSTIISTGKEYKVEVPRSQVLPDADAEWTQLASGLESRAIERWDFALTLLPPAACRMLEGRPPAERPDAALLALHLAEGRGNPRDTVQALLSTSPGWIARHSSWSWRTIASYSAEHDLADLSADAFERAASGQPDGYGALLAGAALNILPVDPSRSRKLITLAEITGHAPLLVAIVRALLDHPDGDGAARRVDPILLSDNETVRASQVTQNFLSDQAVRAGDLNRACYHAQLAMHADPDDSTTMLSSAQTLIRRAHSNQRHDDDLTTAISLLEQAVDQRRKWAGPALDALLSLVEAYAFNGQFDLMLQRCLPSPYGNASQDEAEHPRIRRDALYAAHAVDRNDLVDDIAATLGESIQDRIANVRTGKLRLAPEEQRCLWAGELARAVAESDYEAACMAAVSLAFLGQDQRQQLIPFVNKSIVPAIYLELIPALVTADTDLDVALPTLRSLARRDTFCAEYVILKLKSADRHTDAADLCRSLYERDLNPHLLIAEAQLLIDAQDNRAESTALRAVNSTSGFPIERAHLVSYLGARAAAADNWDAGEKYFNEVLRLRAHPTSMDVWRLVHCQVRQGHLRRAVNAIAQYRPAVTNSEEGSLWLQAHLAIRWDEAKASEAFMLAQQLNDPRLSTALLMQIVSSTRGVPTGHEPPVEADPDLDERRRNAQHAVPAELHRQAFAAMHELVNQFGEATGVTILHGEPDHLVEQMVSMMREQAEARASVKEVLTQIREARLPYGFVATINGQSYATSLVRRSLGVLVSGAADDEEHALDMQDARDALGGPVVVDASALLVLTGVSSPARLEGEFSGLLLPAEAMRDIYRAAYDIRGLAASPGTTGWNQDLDSVVFYELGTEEYTRQLRRAQALEDIAQRITSRSVNELTLFLELMQDRRHASWLHPIQMAHNQGATLWSDDLGLRRLARSAGVSCFGTPALIDALRDRGLDTVTTPVGLSTILQQTAADNRDLALDMVVDVTLHLDDLLQIAEHDDWLPRAGGAVLSRASWWAWQPQPIDDLMTLYQQISTHAPNTLPDWQYAAMLGLGRSIRPADAAARMLAAVALLGFGFEPTDELVVDAVRRARRIASELGLPDPLTQVPAAASSLAGIGKCADPQSTIMAVAVQLGDDLPQA